MATSKEYIDFVTDQLVGVGIVRSRKMFGEYMVYIDETPILLVCDNTVYVKKANALATLLQNADCGFPYEGAKEHYILDIDDMPLCRAVVETLKTTVPTSKKRKP